MSDIKRAPNFVTLWSLWLLTDVGALLVKSFIILEINLIVYVKT